MEGFFHDISASAVALARQNMGLAKRLAGRRETDAWHWVSDVYRWGGDQSGLVGALDGDDSIGASSEPNEGPYFGSRIFPTLGLPTSDGARVLKII